MGISVEPAEGQIRAGKERDGEGARRSGGKRPRAPGERFRSVGGDEAVEIPAAGIEPVDGDFGGVIALALRGDVAARRDAREIGAFRSEERRGGKECDRTCGYRWSPDP